MKRLPLALLALAAAVAIANPAFAAPDGRKNLAIVIYPGVELLDFAGPGEVFAAAQGAFRVYTVAETKAPLKSQGFLTVVPEYSIAGALAGKKATSHWSALATLREFEPTATVLDDVRFVDNGRVMTTAGVSAGIDGALHVVERMLGVEAAWSTARYMQYNWEPAPNAVAGDDRAAMRAWIMQDWPAAEGLYHKIADRDRKDARAQARLAAVEYRLGKVE